MNLSSMVGQVGELQRTGNLGVTHVGEETEVELDKRVIRSS
jgi:hypothetical protein